MNLHKSLHFITSIHNPVQVESTIDQPWHQAPFNIVQRLASLPALPCRVLWSFLSWVSENSPKKLPTSSPSSINGLYLLGKLIVGVLFFSIYFDSNLRISFCCSLLFLPLLPLLSVFLLPLVLVLLLLWLLLFLVLLSPLWTTTTTTTSSSSSSSSPPSSSLPLSPSLSFLTISTMATSRNSGPAI